MCGCCSTFCTYLGLVRCILNNGAVDLSYKYVLQEQWHPLTDELHCGKEDSYIEKSLSTEMKPEMLKLTSCSVIKLNAETNRFVKEKRPSYKSATFLDPKDIHEIAHTFNASRRRNSSRAFSSAILSGMSGMAYATNSFSASTICCHTDRARCS